MPPDPVLLTLFLHPPPFSIFMCQEDFKKPFLLLLRKICQNALGNVKNKEGGIKIRILFSSKNANLTIFYLVCNLLGGGDYVAKHLCECFSTFLLSRGPEINLLQYLRHPLDQCSSTTGDWRPFHRDFQHYINKKCIIKCIKIRTRSPPPHKKLTQ